jgi:tRNA-splicing ligase RtcB
MLKHFKIYGRWNIDSAAVDQINSAMALDCVKAGALMPDAHVGYTLPIGGVVGIKDMIFPSFIGYDLGCGMCAVKTSFNKDSVKSLSKEIFFGIYQNVPVGYKHNAQPVTWRDYKNIPKTDMLDKMFYKKGGFSQLGTLGTGNHFCEIGYDENDVVWFIVHSGSRNVGHSVARHYMREASFLHTGERKAKEGHYGFNIYTTEGNNYLRDMNFCLAFALKNRRIIVQRIENTFKDLGINGDIDWETLINRNHNHADLNLKTGLWIHRKGATHAEKDMMGVIPGNMRDGSFIVRGKGNPDSLYSSSHGAGRLLGRRQAKETLALKDFEDTMGNLTAKVSAETLDESPMAYKSIFDVMKEQSDLVDIVHHVRPIINIKA